MIVKLCSCLFDAISNLYAKFHHSKIKNEKVSSDPLIPP